MKRLILLAGVCLVSLAAVSSAAWRDNPYTDQSRPDYRWPAKDLDGDGVWDHVDHCVNTRPNCIVNEFGCDVDSDGDGVCDGRDQCNNSAPGAKVNDQGCAMGDSRVLRPMPARERELLETGRITLESIYFETEKATLLPESHRALAEAGKALEKYPKLEIEVEGHTDTRGEADYNLQLSQARAEAVREYLVLNYEVDAAKISARGYGETRPVTQERNEAEFKKNRRVVLRVLNPGALPRGVKVDRKE